MEDVKVKFKFSGEDYLDNKFDIKELGRVFESIGDLFENSNLILNKESTLKVKIDSKFVPGSFEFVIDLQQYMRETIIPVLAGSGISAILNIHSILSIIFNNKNGLIVLMKYLFGTTPDKIEKNGENILVFKKDGTSLEVKREALILFEDKRVRRALGHAIADSLSNKGTESIQIEVENTKVEIDKSEKEAFLYIPENDEEVFDIETIEADLEIVGISFDPEKKWEFKSYKDTFSAEIASPAFIKKIENGEVFKKGDKLKAILQTEYYKTQQQIRKRRTILDVTAHIAPSIQGELF
jgi:hypothetical protein